MTDQSILYICQTVVALVLLYGLGKLFAYMISKSKF